MTFFRIYQPRLDQICSSSGFRTVNNEYSTSWFNAYRLVMEIHVSDRSKLSNLYRMSLRNPSRSAELRQECVRPFLPRGFEQCCSTTCPKCCLEMGNLGSRASGSGVGVLGLDQVHTSSLQLKPWQVCLNALSSHRFLRDWPETST